ncbi:MULTISPECIES: septum formation family protein [unclassified Nocardioides]|uniref:septum formation family protein n=1 Tax=unclassified Nocardioides TaxID=2615069 RepID=UPI0006F74822|nr:MULTISPECIES: septum formation family protein [unclassified Nocardioides]KRA29857.1 hypothetical protein ASD81_19275 [Nocardioides sp. Root614]KRA86780.1 hypothetical protein ASD84_21500 [Nocardioides sp. Root682]
MSIYPHYPPASGHDYRPATSTPSSTTAGWALGLSLLSCCFLGNIVSTFMALSALRRSKDTGHDHDQGLAVAALVINALTAGSLVIVVYFGLFLGLFSTDVPSYAKAPANADPQVVTDVDLLEPGDCLQIPAARGEDDPDRLVACTERHDAEVTHRVDLTDPRFPGVRAIDRIAEVCTGKPFQEYVGAAFSTARLDVSYYYPTAETWREGARAIVCTVTDPQGPMKGSVKGSATGDEAETDAS